MVPPTPFWLLFAGAGCDARPGRGTRQFTRGPALRLRAAAVSSIVKCLIPRRAERPGHLGSVLTLAKLSCLIISGAAGVRVHRFISCIRQACFLWKLSASEAAVTLGHVAASHPRDAFSIPPAGLLQGTDAPGCCLCLDAGGGWGGNTCFPLPTQTSC